MARLSLPQVRKLLHKAEEVLGDLDGWAHNCHAASLAVVKAEVIPGARVARGSCRGVFGQHSWVVVGDPYDKGAPIIDPTLWSYDADVEGIWTGTRRRDKRHTPKGAGSIWNYGCPVSGGGNPIELAVPVSKWAASFLDMVGPLDREGWHTLALAPVEGWPAAEIVEAMASTPDLAWLVPIDVVGMLTDLNPEGLYLPDKVEV